MKKLLAVCLVFVLVGTLLCGCGGPAVDLGDGPSVSREEAVVISEKDGEITGRLDLDRYSFAQLSEAEKEENVLSFDGDVILFDGSYKGSVTLEGNGHKKKCSAEFHTNNSEPIRFTLTADYGAQERYVIFIAGGHASEGADSDTTEDVTPASLGLYVTFNGERYQTYPTQKEAEANAIHLDKRRLTIRATLNEDYPFVLLIFDETVSQCQLSVQTPELAFNFYGDYYCVQLRYEPKWGSDGDYLYEYIAFKFD